MIDQSKSTSGWIKAVVATKNSVIDTHSCSAKQSLVGLEVRPRLASAACPSPVIVVSNLKCDIAMFLVPTRTEKTGEHFPVREYC